MPPRWNMVPSLAIMLWTVIASVTSAEPPPNNCDWIEVYESCIKEASCSEGGTMLFTWEDCAVGFKLFTITNGSLSINPSCAYTSTSGAEVSLNQALDAEEDTFLTCGIDGAEPETYLFLNIIDVNEFSPYPSDGTIPTMNVNVTENAGPHLIADIYYKDDDYEETKTLECKQIGDQNKDLFTLTADDYDTSTNTRKFTFKLLKELNFENGVFYKMEYDIISTDEKGTQKNFRHTFFINVVDTPDSKPVWTNIVPFFELSECREEAELFNVTAQDRDMDINYDIAYSLSAAQGDEYFDIDKKTGIVSRIKDIDREVLLEQGISSFSLTITATEYKPSGELGEEPNSDQQVTLVTILDCNNKQPTFNAETYNITIPELTLTNTNTVLGLNIVVRDMDQNDAGAFYLLSNDSKSLRISPDKGKQEEKVTLTALFQDEENNIFDYEKQQDTPLFFKITAVEEANADHNDEALVIITLTDENDNKPIFTEENYTEDLKENTAPSSSILSVAATDDDLSPDIGVPSIRYTLDTYCNELDIDPVSGEVTLALQLDYDDDNLRNVIECSVYARDYNGTGFQGASRLTVTVIDIVDEPPRFMVNDVMEIIENSAVGTPVGSFIIEDKDADAKVYFSITSAACSVGHGTADVSGWFDVTAETANHPNYPAMVTVLGEIDREGCNQVTLNVRATDNATQENEKNADAEVVINILDEKDVAPIFLGDYEGLAIDELEEGAEQRENKTVFTITVTDLDEGDKITLSVTNGGDKVYLSTTEVEILPGDKDGVEVKVLTVKDADIDREKEDTFEVGITLTDTMNLNTSERFTIKINDLNDKKPVINEESCPSETLFTPEDDGTKALNGTVIHILRAYDEDKEEPHNKVHFFMQNDQITDAKNRRKPFTVDETSGEITILLIEGEKILDREKDTEWELVIQTYDECAQNDPKCEVKLSNTCNINITVLDVNDNPPEDLEGYIEVTDFLKKDEDVGDPLRATDIDEGDNAAITYAALGTYRPPNYTKNWDLFDAKDEPMPPLYFFRLISKEDFAGKQYTGQYVVHILAKDKGNPSLNNTFEITVNVNDANDEVPYFILDQCPGEAENTIRMEENDYTPGENGMPNPMTVKCSGSTGTDPFWIRVDDQDIEVENREVTVNIDMEKSTVENCNATEQELLSYWSLEPTDCTNGCYIKLKHSIDREVGTAYNLSIHVKNTNTVDALQESWSHVRVVVTNKMEFTPFFCDKGNCTQTVYMYENHPNAFVNFIKAIDQDNVGVNPGDEEYNKVYYYIVGGDKDDFQMISDQQEKIVLKNHPEGLDREKIESYSLKILVTNNIGDENKPIGDDLRNDTLNLIIRVGDDNDEFPNFSGDVIFTSFMESNGVNERIALIEALDKDLNETLTYEMLDDLMWFETDLKPEDPFRLEVNNPRSVYLTINADMKGMTRGYCNFTITVEDKVGHKSAAEVKVYIINEDYQVSMYYSNEVEQVTNKKTDIEEIYTSVYKYPCTIDSISPTLSSSGSGLSNKTTAYMHFINEEKNEPVMDKIILDLSENFEVMEQLLQRLRLIGINLDSVDKNTVTEDGRTPEDTILTLQILLGVVSLILGSFVVLLISVYCLRTKRLKRKIKVLSTNTFGSKHEGLNQMGLDLEAVPGTNHIARDHGNQNPVFSETEGYDFKQHDTESISSGDSVLVGVEDNPEFKNYSAKGGLSTTDEPGPPPGVQTGMKGNPLLNLGALKDSGDASAPSLHEIEGSDTSSVKQINSNFSFL